MVNAEANKEGAIFFIRAVVLSSVILENSNSEVRTPKIKTRSNSQKFSDRGAKEVAVLNCWKTPKKGKRKSVTDRIIIPV